MLNFKHAQPIIVVRTDVDEHVAPKENADAKQNAEWEAIIEPVQDIDYESSSDDEKEEPEFALANRVEALRLPAAVVHVDNDDKYNDLTPGQIDERFWTLIGKLNWHDMSDQRMNKNTVGGVIARFSNLEKQIFKDRYSSLYDELRLKLQDALTANNVNFGDVPKVISHFIARGRDVYTTVGETPEFCEYYIGAGECQDLDDMLPYEWQKN
jgi:hypothetical protein